MNELRSALSKQMSILASVTALIVFVGAVLWFSSPPEGDKYGELGGNLIFGAGLAFGVMGVERVVSSREKVRDQAAAEERRLRVEAATEQGRLRDEKAAEA